MRRIHWLVPSVWHYVALDGTKGELACSDLVRVDHISGPHDMWGMLTDYCDRQVSPSRFPVATVAFAATNELAVIPFEKAPPALLSQEKLLALVQPKLDSAAIAVRARLRTQEWFLDTDQDSTHADVYSATLGVRGDYIASVFVSQMVGNNLHDRGCYLNVSLAAWILGSESGARLVDWRVWQDDCDYKMASGETPHAVFSFDRETYVVSSEWNYESVSPRLFRVQDESMQLVELRDD